MGMTFLISLPFLMALWRVVDGGWHRFSGVAAISWALVLGGSYIALSSPLVAAVFGGLLVWQALIGYRDWTRYDLQLVRCYPAGLAFVALSAGKVLDLEAVPWLWVAAGIASVVSTNVVQPWLREVMVGRGPWGDSSNRYAEALEGFGVGLAIAVCG